MVVTVSELRKITDKRQAKKVIRGLGADTSIAVLTKLNERYRDGKPAVSDSVYDLLYDAALELFPDDAFFGKVGGGSRADDQKLQYYMSSRSKFKDASWNLISNWVGKHSILIAAKKDGIALQLHYQGGRIVSAATQGKTGYTGKSVLHLILHCPNVPQTIATKADVFIRCEGIFPKSVSNEVLGITEGRGGRRNIAAGVLNRTQANSDTKAKMQHIDIIALQLFGSKKKLPDQYAALHAAGFKVPPYKVLEANELNADRLHRMLVNLKKTNYDCDGLVLTYADISLPVETSGNPDWSMAYKESDATTQVVAEVTDVVWNVGKTGKIAPTIKTKPVRLGDITASSFTGFSGTFILTGKRLAEGPGKAKPIGVGAKVLVERAGDVIPHIVSVVEGAKRAALPDVEYEHRGADFYVVTDEHTESQVVNKVIYALRALGVKGAADSSVTQIVQALAEQGESDPIDVLTYVLTDKELWDNVVGGARAKTVFANIEAALENCTFAQLMDASGVFQHLGVGRANDFAQANAQLGVGLPTKQDLKKAGYDLYTMAIGIYRMPEKTAREIEENWNLFVRFVNSTRGHGWSTQKKKVVSEDVEKEQPLRGKVVYLTGLRSPELAEKIKQAGGEIQSSFNASRCNLLIAKDVNANPAQKKYAQMSSSSELMSLAEFQTKYKL